MSTYIDPNFTPEGLRGYQGYHLQVFRSGRVKLSLQHEGKAKTEYYAERPKRDREAYGRQKARTGQEQSAHFAVVDALLAETQGAVVYRVHVRGDNNKTADNAHVVSSQQGPDLCVVMGEVVHRWELPQVVRDEMLAAQGLRSGEASIFNHYVPSYEHDWAYAHFSIEEYGFTARDPRSAAEKEEDALYGDSRWQKPVAQSRGGRHSQTEVAWEEEY